MVNIATYGNTSLSTHVTGICAVRNYGAQFRFNESKVQLQQIFPLYEEWQKLDWFREFLQHSQTKYLFSCWENFSYVRWKETLKITTFRDFTPWCFVTAVLRNFFSVAAHLTNDVHICDTLLNYGRNCGLAGSCEWLSHNWTESERLPTVCRLPIPCKEPITA